MSREQRDNAIIERGIFFLSKAVVRLSNKREDNEVSIIKTQSIYAS